MCEVVDFKNYKSKKITGKIYGNILISVYKTLDTNHSIFVIKPENEEVLGIADIIEEALKMY
ncbi:MAG: hypothetical protein IKF52_03300 [Clostridia bacterium]|nr:hypothetical protein [Clostridia bacterium]